MFVMLVFFALTSGVTSHLHPKQTLKILSLSISISHEWELINFWLGLAVYGLIDLEAISPITTRDVSVTNSLWQLIHLC